MKNSKGKKILNKKTKRKNSAKETKENLLKSSEKKTTTENMNPENLEFCKKNLSRSYVVDMYPDSFCVFKAIDDKYYLICSEGYSIISYNILNNQKVIEITNAHNNSHISKFRHYLDQKNRRDLLISISDYDNTIKLWNIQKWECIHTFKEIYQKNRLYSACFLNYEKDNIIYIISSNFAELSNKKDIYPIKVFDLGGKLIKDINDSECKLTMYVDSFYDKRLFKHYILSCNGNYVVSYDFDDNKIYHKYNAGSVNKINYGSSIVINDSEEVVQLIQSNLTDNKIKIYDFHKGTTIKTIYGGAKIYEVCLWDSEYLFVGNRGDIKLINIKEGKIVKSVDIPQTIIGIKILEHPQYGKCLISQSQYGEINMLYNKH